MICKNSRSTNVRTFSIKSRAHRTQRPNRTRPTRGLVILVARLSLQEHKRIFSLCHYFAIMKPVAENESRHLGQNEMAGLRGKSGPPGNLNAFKHGLAAIQKRRINGPLNQDERVYALKFPRFENEKQLRQTPPHQKYSSGNPRSSTVF